MAEQKRKSPRKKWAVLGVIVAILAVAGAGFWTWHETPGFCAAFCHNMDEYLETYSEDQDAPGTDKYGNSVANTNAMMATLHRSTASADMPEVRCMGCHEPVIGEQVSEAISWATGNYLAPLDERVGDDLTHWAGKDDTQLCANESCHADLLGEDGLVDRDKLAAATNGGGFNAHMRYHEGIDMTCTQCHKGHRASVVMCTSCHHHENVALPEGWVTAAESNEVMNGTFAGYYDETYKSLPRAA